METAIYDLACKWQKFWGIHLRKKVGGLLSQNYLYGI